jgi:hypothetical protein
MKIKRSGKMEAGVRIAPSFIIVLYIMFVALDIYTTWLGIPDLKYEGNIIIKWFHLWWPQIIILSIIAVVAISTGYVLASRYIKICFYSIETGNCSLAVTMVHDYRLLASAIALCCFYSHLFYSVFITCSNYLSYLWTFRIMSPFSGIADFYAYMIIRKIPHYFTWSYVVFISLGIAYAMYKICRVRHKCRLLSLKGADD